MSNYLCIKTICLLCIKTTKFGPKDHFLPVKADQAYDIQYRTQSN